ncbi:MAG: hypothetical protein ACOCQG_05800 [Candidatus Nanoarchaeia archaeon]
MDEKTLEEKLALVKKGIVETLKEKELGLNDYKNKVSKLLLNEGLLDEKKGIYYKDPSNYIAESFIFNGDFLNFHFGLKRHYVSIKQKGLSTTEAKEDVKNYKHVYMLSRKYISEGINTEEFTEKQFYDTVQNYVLNLLDKLNIDEERKFQLLPEITKGLRKDLCLINFKGEEITYKGFTQSQLDKALEKLTSGEKNFQFYENK